MTDRELVKKRKCAGIRSSWPWKGYPCGAFGKYLFREKWYCGTHFAVATKRELTELQEGKEK
ncbi:MAG: hypothetical protein ABSG90_12800 [Dehalococcoidia bacterium]|jgi:hypothetical protein